MLKPVSAQVDLILGHRIKHERVIWIWGMTQGKDFNRVLVFRRDSLVVCHFRTEDYGCGIVGQAHRLSGRALVAPLTERRLHPKQNSPEFLRGCLKLLYAYLISNLIGSRPLEASASPFQAERSLSEFDR